MARPRRGLPTDPRGDVLPPHEKLTLDPGERVYTCRMARKKTKIFLLDTNVILHDFRCIYQFEDNDIVLPIVVLEELDRFKKGNDLINFHAREFTRELDSIAGDSLFSLGLPLGPKLGKLFIETGKAFSRTLEDSFPEQTADHRILAIVITSYSIHYTKLYENGKHPGEAGFDPKNSARYGVAYDLWSAMYYPTLWSNGGGVISDDGKTVLIDSPESIEAVQRLADLINKDHTMPYMGGGSGLPAPSVMLANGQLGFWVTGQWNFLEIGGMKDLPFGVAALPIQKKPAQIYLSGVNVVFKATKHPEEAWLLQKWMMDPSKTLNLYTSGLWMPTKLAYYNDPARLKEWTDNPVHPAGYKEAVLDSMSISRNEPIKIRNINQIWGDCLNPAFSYNFV